jgi:hypothetical protein
MEGGVCVYAWSRSRTNRSHRQRHLPLPNAKTTAKLGWR